MLAIRRYLISWPADGPGLSGELARGRLVDQLRRNSGLLFTQYAVNETTILTGTECGVFSEQFGGS
jgi:hypothetical protein